MDCTNFWYIKLRQSGDRSDRKKPAESWGGYMTDFSENAMVYTWEQTQAMAHSNFAIIGHRGPHQLVVIDVDCYKIDDFDWSDIEVPDQEVSIVRSDSDKRDIPGYHFYCLIQEDEADISGAKPYIDIKANRKGHAVSPFHNDDYSIVNSVELHPFVEVEELNQAFSLQGENIVTSDTKYATYQGDFDFEIPDDPPEDMPDCLRKTLQMRRDIPRDGSFSDPWRLDSIVGRRLVAYGYSKTQAMEFLREFPPQDGFDERESSYQLDKLYQKKLNPDSLDNIRELAGDELNCHCNICHLNKQENLDYLIAPGPSKTYKDYEQYGK